jgi:hypothetical protein
MKKDGLPVLAQAGRKVESLVVQVSGGALTRTSSVNPSIKIKSNFRENRVDTIFRAGLQALLFFCFSQGCKPCSLFVLRRALLPLGFVFRKASPPALFYFHISARSQCSIAACSELSTSIYRRGVIQIRASLDRAFFPANLQLERIRASEPRRGGVCKISTLPERDRTMLRGSK